jgi:TM2 domain-containing membrane protein YozV
LNPICPYCRTEVGETEGERKDCPGCGAPHHADCFAENGGCTVFGCAHAPSDEAKVTVSGTDLMGNVVTRQAPVPTPSPVMRPGLSLGSGYTTFRAPAMSVEQAVPETATGRSGALPPPMAGTGVAPPPQAGRGPEAQRAPSSLAHSYPVAQPKTRVIFVLLGIFLGVFGVHNFYAGYAKKGAIQLCVTLLAGLLGEVSSLIWAVIWIWGIIEICTVSRDAEGTQFV